MSSSTSQIIKSSLNIGNLPYLTDEKLFIGDHELKRIRYHSDNIVPNFPLIVCSDRLKECLEFNLFLVDRKIGAFSLKSNKHTEDDDYVWSKDHLGAKKGKSLNIESIHSIAKDLRTFLDWMVAESVSYEEIMAVPIDFDPHSIMEAETILPVWRFQKHLTNRVKKALLSYNSGNRILQNIRAFYIWSFRRGEVSALPFSLKLKTIKVRRQDSTESLFSMPSYRTEHPRALTAYISNLKIPKSAIPKAIKPQQGLTAFTANELQLLMKTDVYTHRTYGLFIKCALLAGLRANEVVQINRNEIIAPSENRSSFSLSLLRKFNKAANLRISSTLMNLLWDYTQDRAYLERQRHHEAKYGISNPDHPLPLFINSSGQRMVTSSVTNTMSKVRVELRERGLPPLERGFHDLRATFATYWALALIKKGYTPNEIKSKLMLLMSHESFETTKRYIDFALEGRAGVHGAMEPWVIDIYQEVLSKVNSVGTHNDS